MTYQINVIEPPAAQIGRPIPGRHTRIRSVEARKSRFRGSQFAQLTAFVAVASAQSFTRAAEQMGLSVPTVSEAIKSLEADFGVRLFNRTTRSVGLTEAGEHLLFQLVPLLDGVEVAVDSLNEFRDSPVGRLRLSVHPIAAEAIVGPILSSFSAEYPGVALELSVGAARHDIAAAGFDAGIQPAKDVPKDMIGCSVGQLGFACVASPEYLLQRPPLDHPGELDRHNCIRYRWENASVDGTWSFVSGAEKCDVAINGTLVANSFELALRATLGGVGIAQFPEALVARSIAEGGLKRLLPKWSTPEQEFLLFYPSRRHVPLKLRALVSLLRKKAKTDTDSVC